MGLSRVWVLLWLVMAVKALENVVSPVGQSVILPCKAPGNMSVVAVEWRKRGLDGYVLAHRDDQLDPEDQHASYRGRVELKDRHLQNGDLSLLLMNVMANDSGTYECKAFQGKAKRSKRHSEVLGVIKLDVTDDSLSGGGGSRQRLLVLVPVGAAAVIILVASILIYIKNRRNISSSPPY